VQIHRMLEIAYLLMSGKVLTAGALAQRFEVSKRTIYRDVEALSAAGIPVYMTRGRGGGIALSPGSSLGRAVLTEEEKADVLASLKALGGVAPGAADGALKKLGALFGGVEVDWIEVDFSSWSDSKCISEAFSRLKASILGRRVVSFTYAGGRGETARRTVEPLKLCFKGQAWYLYGYCRDRRAERLFKLSRMREIEVREESFSREAPLQALKPGPIPKQDLMEVALKLPEEMAFRVYDEFERHERLKDGSFLVQAMLPRGEGMYQYVLSFGERCEVLSPPEARREIAERLEKILERYRI